MRNRKLFKVVVVSALVLFGGFVAFLGYTYWQTSPSKLYVTNITDRSASISWVSNEATTGVVIVKEGNYMLPLKLTTNGSTRAGFDDRDRARAELEASEQTAENLADGTAATADDVQTDVTIKNYGEYYVHHATITNLKPETEYDFMVGNGWFFHKEKSVVGGSDKFTTFAQLDQLATPNPSYGKVVLPGEGDDYESSTDSVLYMRVDFGGNKVSQVLSSVTAENGSWYIDLGNARDEFGNEVGEVTEDLNEKVWVEGGPNGMVEEFDNPTSLDAPMQILFLETDEVEARAPFDFLAGEVNAECCEAFTCVDADGTTVASYGGDDDFGGGSCETRKTGICPSGSSPVGGAKCGDTSSTPGAPSQPGGSPTAPAGACSSPQSGNCHNKYNTSIQIGSNPYNACTCTFLDSSNPALCGCHFIPPQTPSPSNPEPSEVVAQPGVNCGSPSSSNPCPITGPETVVQEPPVVTPPPTNDDPITIEDATAIPVSPVTGGDEPGRYDGVQWTGSNARAECERLCDGNCVDHYKPETEVGRYSTPQFASAACGNNSNCYPGTCAVDEASTGEYAAICNLYQYTECYVSDEMFQAPSVVKSAYAQTNPESQEFLFDPSAGVYYVGEAGVYQIEYEGQTYEAIVGEGDQNVILYIDENANGTYDEGTDIQISVNPSELNVAQTAEAHTYDLQAGFNFIHLPFIPEDYPMASDLLEYVNNEYGGIAFSIAKFDDTWKVVGANGGEFNVNDFQLVPGAGYLLKITQDTEVTFTGREILYETEGDTAPVFFAPGWNLVGIYGSNAAVYSAESMIDSLNEYETTDFTAVNVTRWPPEKARYEGLQKEMGEDGEYDVYGFDFPLNQYTSYFVRITEGTGNWEPAME